jgi:hypothetical protein
MRVRASIDAPPGVVKKTKSKSRFFRPIPIRVLPWDPAMPAPRVWVLPFPDVEPFRRPYKGNMKNKGNMKTPFRAQMLRDGRKYENGGISLSSLLRCVD